MTVQINYQDLWDRGGYGKDNPLENSLSFVFSKAKEKAIDKEIAELAINEVFLRMASGHQYPLDKCPCGCGIDKSGTAVTHEMIRLMTELDKEVRLARSEIMENRMNTAIAAHMSRENEEFLAEVGTPSWWTRLWLRIRGK